jgi:hypothetical protein
MKGILQPVSRIRILSMVVPVMNIRSMRVGMGDLFMSMKMGMIGFFIPGNIHMFVYMMVISVPVPVFMHKRGMVMRMGMAFGDNQVQSTYHDGKGNPEREPWHFPED